jgi:hypothetical protein
VARLTDRIDHPGRHARRDFRHAAERRRRLLADDRVVRKFAAQCLGDEPLVGLVGLGYRIDAAGTVLPDCASAAARRVDAADRRAAFQRERRRNKSLFNVWRVGEDGGNPAEAVAAPHADIEGGGDGGGGGHGEFGAHAV